MGVLLWLLRGIVILFVVRMVLRMFTPPKPMPRRPAPSKPQEVSGGTLVRDPQCGTYIPETKAIVVGRGESVTFFCSTTCRDAWAAAHRS
jgi:uncharacterized protein